ncbi:phosphoinositide 3-kinase regulatory subunit 4 isoform X2 [Leptidea sinapis]|uniref:phosphoinositide 3-kinase regulatory subunit 4 isoform X2 n=1 Tax=Leptidea sinapis TaxID=189913 RepID=UPI0021C38FD0|nr:phosphoinositide 3-kinase regulatory subunit 4 isoform X2 [Leptidea sinapis]
MRRSKLTLKKNNSDGGSQSISLGASTSPSGAVPGEPGASVGAVPVHSQMGHSASYVQYSMAPCRVELRNLITRTQQKFNKSLRSGEDRFESSEETAPVGVGGWRPGNQLLAYLNEHKACVNQLACVPAHRSMFGSCSDDGSVRVWDAAKLQGHAYVNKSKAMYNRGAGGVVSLASCEGGQSLVGATREGSIFVLRLDSGSSRLTLSQCRQVDTGAVACASAGGVHAHVISYATLDATIVGWDLRAPGNAWKLQGDLKQGVFTCLYANSCGYLAVGTSSGAICVWDLRFHLPITTLKHPNSERIRRIVGAGGYRSSRIWSVGGRDASAWCLESAHRTHALWTAAQPPLNYTAPSSNYMSAIFSAGAGGGGEEGWVATGGSDLRLRLWDARQADDSHVLVHAPHDRAHDIKYRSRIIDGTTVIQECCKSNPSPPPFLIEDNVYKSVESRTFHHIAPITDITVVEASKNYLVSSSADGVINVWK